MSQMNLKIDQYKLFSLKIRGKKIEKMNRNLWNNNIGPEIHVIEHSEERRDTVAEKTHERHKFTNSNRLN